MARRSGGQPHGSGQGASPADLRAQLRSAGYRVTVPRLVILEAIYGLDEHFTAEQVHERVRARFPDLNMSTIYRNLEALADAGMLTCMSSLTGPRTFALDSHGAHHHLVCRRCGHVEELEDAAFEALRAYARERRGFQVELAHQAITGRCAACADAGAGAPDAATGG